MKTTTVSLRVPRELRGRLAALAEATDRTMNYHASAALEEYLSVQQWQVEGVQEAISAADHGAPSVEQKTVRQWVESWGEAEERKAPL